LRGTNANGAVLADKFRVIGTDNNINLQISGSGSSYLNTGYSLGIATTSPRYLLDVWGDMAIGTSTGTNIPALYVDSGNGGQVGIGTTTLSTNLLTVGTTTPNLVVANNGYVGIGTAGPGTPLDVAGEVGTSGVLRIQRTNASDYEIARFEAISAGQDANISFKTQAGVYIGMGIDASDSNKFKITTDNLLAGGTTLLTITTGGNVGISTTTPAMTLDVAGMIRAYKTSTTTCDAAIYGAIFYNQIDDIFWGCKVAGWTRLDQ